MTDVPQYLVYCDESRHDPHLRNPFMGIGGLWVPRAARDRLRKRLDAVAREHRLNAEMKWTKVSQLSLAGYRSLFDVFAEEPELRYRIIVVDQRRLNYIQFQDGDRELGFYKFYYQMLKKWLEPATEYFILLDHTVNAEHGRLEKLRKVLNNSVADSTKVTRVDPGESRDSRLAQLADVLTGAVTAAWSGTRAGSAKASLQTYLAQLLGWTTLRTSSASPKPTKFNVFAIQLLVVEPKGGQAT